MKVSVTFKTPDVLRYVAQDIIDQNPNIEEDDVDDTYLLEEAEEGLKEKLSKWIEYGELVTIDFDTEAGTAVVQEIK